MWGQCTLLELLVLVRQRLKPLLRICHGGEGNFDAWGQIVKRLFDSLTTFVHCVIPNMRNARLGVYKIPEIRA
jgi:hypothetical protein